MMKPQLSYYYEAPESGSVYEVYDLKNLPAILQVEDAVDTIDMTALNDYVIGNSIHEALDKEMKEDSSLQRLSLAYENLRSFPRIILDELSENICILDISHNKFDDLMFLGNLKRITSLICDHNEITSNTEMPYMPKLELLWMNNCNIANLYPWCRKLRNSCPNLQYLSLMGNPAIPSYYSAPDFSEYIKYRLLMISFFPKLIHLDEKKITDNERQAADKLYRRPILDKLMPMANNYIRRTTEKLTDLFVSTPIDFKQINVNNII